MGMLPNSLAAQSAIDEKIAQEMREIGERTERVRLLKTERNKHCTINKIPDEVSVHILLFVKLEAEERLEWRPRTNKLRLRKWSRRDWFPVMWVCRSWRNLVLGCSEFWTLINAPSIHLPYMLSLAQAPFLEILLDEFAKPQKQFWSSVGEVLSTRFHQTQELEVWLESPLALSQLFAIPSIDYYPILKGFTLSIEPPTAENVDDDALHHSWWDMPGLNSLMLVGGVTSLPQSFFAPHLTKLHIDIKRAIPWSWALDLFQNSPRVEEALIQPLGPEPDDYVASPASLPHLHTLTLELKGSKPFAIFGYLVILTETSVTVRHRPSSIDVPMDLSDSLEAMIARFSSACGPSHVERIAIYFHDFFISVYRPGDYYKLDECDSEPFLHFDLPISPRVPVSSYLPLCLSLPLSKTKIISLAGVDELSKPMVLSIMSAAGPLNTLELGQEVVPLLNLLFAPADVNLPLLPELEYIVLKGSYEGVDNEYENSDLKNILPVMFRLLRERRKLRIPIQNLRCWDWECVPRSVMKKLRGLVEVVEGDRLEINASYL